MTSRRRRIDATAGSLSPSLEGRASRVLVLVRAGHSPQRAVLRQPLPPIQGDPPIVDLTPLPATLPRYIATAVNKGLMQSLSPVDATLTKFAGGSL